MDLSNLAAATIIAAEKRIVSSVSITIQREKASPSRDLALPTVLSKIRFGYRIPVFVSPASFGTRELSPRFPHFPVITLTE
jgi:hypothetical protein